MLSATSVVSNLIVKADNSSVNVGVGLNAVLIRSFICFKSSPTIGDGNETLENLYVLCGD